jgi:hypothetical protein
MIPQFLHVIRLVYSEAFGLTSETISSEDHFRESLRFLFHLRDELPAFLKKLVEILQVNSQKPMNFTSFLTTSMVCTDAPPASVNPRK